MSDSVGRAGGRGGEGADLKVEEPRVDIASLSDDTSRLIRIGVSALVGLALTFADTLPALHMVDDRAWDIRPSPWVVRSSNAPSRFWARAWGSCSSRRNRTC